MILAGTLTGVPGNIHSMQSFDGPFHSEKLELEMA